jgi:hypothetical protein
MWGFTKFAIAVGVVLFLFYLVSEHNTEREVQPGTPEYDAHMKQRIAECVKRELSEDLDKSRVELPVLPTPQERLAECRALESKIDKLYPGTRPTHQ